MGIVGLTFYGPHGVFYYMYIQPYVIDKLLPMLVPFNLIKRFFAVKVMCSAFFDTFIYNLPYFSLALFWAGLLKQNFDYKKSATDVYNQVWVTYTTGWMVYPWRKIVLYGAIPMYIRGIAAIFFRLIWLIIFSFIVHSY